MISKLRAVGGAFEGEWNGREFKSSFSQTTWVNTGEEVDPTGEAFDDISRACESWAEGHAGDAVGDPSFNPKGHEDEAEWT